MIPNPSLVAFRFGYGLPLSDTSPVTPDAMLAALAGPDVMAARWPIAGFAAAQEHIHTVADGKRAVEKDPAAAASVSASAVALDLMGQAALRATIARCLEADDVLRERLVAFWADHFTISSGGRPDAITAYAFVEDAIRPHLAGPFHTMLAAVVRHPGMLLYLDQTRSIGPNSRQAKGRNSGGLNENLARELLELHSLGVGGAYTQTDVRQLAELLTGLTYDARRGSSFDSRRAEPGPETVLGKSYDGKGDAPILAALQDISRHADTARHICRKLAVHFLSDTPDAAVLDAMVAAWGATGGDLMAVYSALLNHPAAWDRTAHKARQPWDFVISALRGLGVRGQQVVDWDDKDINQLVLRHLHNMGQRWKSPPGPDGWPEEIEVWITPQGMAERIDWAMTRPARLVRPLPHPVDLAKTVLGDRASAAVLWAAERAESRAEGIGVVLASPEFNRR